MRRYLTSRRVLAASIGVATVTYVVASSGCGTNAGVGNLMAPDFDAAGRDATVDSGDAPHDATADSPTDG